MDASLAKPESANRLAHISFNDDHIEAVKQPDGTVWVGIQRCCDSLGIDYPTQETRLKAAAWATTQMICAVCDDGEPTQVLMLRADRFPMWLATINNDAVAPPDRDKLAAYQNDASDIVAAYFAPNVVAGVDANAINRALTQNAQVIAMMHAWMLRMNPDLAGEGASANQGHQRGPFDLSTICGRIEFARREHQLSKSGVERAAEFRRGELSTFLNRETKSMRPHRSARLAAALGVRQQWLDYGTGRMSDVGQAPLSHRR